MLNKSLSSSLFERHTSTGIRIFLSGDFEQIFGQIFSERVKQLATQIW